MSIVLVGYRGSGKSTIGRLLSQRLSLPLLDTDTILVDRAGMDIRTIFDRHGEPHFRDLETDALVHALASGQSILSTGGGIILRDHNRRLLKSSRQPVVYLQGSAELLLSRIQADAASHTNRPNLTTLGGGIDEVRHLLTQRDPLYREVATVTLVVDSLTAEEAATKILNSVTP